MSYSVIVKADRCTAVVIEGEPLTRNLDGGSRAHLFSDVVLGNYIGGYPVWFANFLDDEGYERCVDACIG
jgi:hypothetical protein